MNGFGFPLTSPLVRDPWHGVEARLIPGRSLPICECCRTVAGRDAAGCGARSVCPDAWRDHLPDWFTSRRAGA